MSHSVPSADGFCGRRCKPAALPLHPRCLRVPTTEEIVPSLQRRGKAVKKLLGRACVWLACSSQRGQKPAALQKTRRRKKPFPPGGGKGFSRSMERETRFELATFSLATRHSTTELLPHRKGYSNAARLWWARGDLNSYALRHQLLRLTCLPFHHSPAASATRSSILRAKAGCQEGRRTFSALFFAGRSAFFCGPILGGPGIGNPSIGYNSRIKSRSRGINAPMRILPMCLYHSLFYRKEK